MEQYMRARFVQLGYWILESKSPLVDYQGFLATGALP